MKASIQYTILMVVLLVAGAGVSSGAISQADRDLIQEQSKILTNTAADPGARAAAAAALITKASGYSVAEDKAAALKPLADILHGADSTLTLTVLEALGNSAALLTLNGGDSEKALSALVVTKLSSTDAAVRAMAITTVSKHKNAGMENRLIALLGNLKSPLVARVAAAQALGSIGELPAVPTLIAGLDTVDALQANACAHALSLITTNKRLGKDVAQWRAWWDANKMKSLQEIREDAEIEERSAILSDKNQDEQTRINVAVILLTQAKPLTGEPRLRMLRPLIDALNATEESLSIAVLKALGTTSLITLDGDQHDQALSARVVGKLGSADPAVRAAAIDTVTKHRNPGMENRLIGVLGNKDIGAVARASAAQILGIFRSKNAVGPLIRAFDPAENLALRIAVAQALGRIEELSAIPTLIGGLKSEHVQLKKACGEALRELTLNERLGSSPDAWQEWWPKNKGKTLRQIQRDEHKAAIVDYKDKLNELQSMLAKWLIRDLDRTDITPELIHNILSNNHYKDILDTHNWSVILKVLKDREEAKTAAVRPQLNGLLGYPGHVEVRRRAAEILIEVGDAGSMTPLVARLNVEPDKETRVAMAEALLKIVKLDPTQAKMTTDLFIKLLIDPDERVRERAATALGFLKDLKAIPGLLKQLAVKDNVPVEKIARVRFYAVEALGKLKAAAAVPAIIGLLQVETDRGVRKQCVGALGQVGGDPAKNAVLTILSSQAEDATVRAEAILAAETVLGPALEPILLPALQGLDTATDAQHVFRRAAVGALGRIGSTAAHPQIVLEITTHGEKVPEVGTTGWSALLAILQRAEGANHDVEVISKITALQTQFAEKAFGPHKEPFVDLLKACQAKREAIAKQTADQIAKLGSEEAAPAAIEELKKHGKDAIEPLIAALANPSEEVKKKVVGLLEEMTGRKFGANQAQWQEWHKTQ